MRILSCFIVSVIAGSAATAVVAKDLPRRDAPASKLTGCEWAGEGFAKMPGTDTCVKVGGFVRAEAAVSSSGTAFFPPSR